MTVIKNPFKLLALISFIKQLHLFFPIVILIYQAKGVGIGDYFLAQGIYLWAMVFMEIPSGYFGDLFSRRLNLAFSAFLYVLGCVVWLLGYGFWPILAGELLFGFGDAFSSGTQDAYIYDLAKQYKKKNLFHRILSKQMSVEKTGFFCAACSGAFVFYFLGANGTIIATMCCYLTAFVLYFALPEVKVEKRLLKNKNPLADIFGVFFKSLKNNELQLLILAYTLLTGSMAVFHWGLQPLMVEKQVPIYMFSLVTGAALLAWTFWSAIAGRLLDKIAFRGVVWFSWGLFALAYLLTIIVCLTSSDKLIYVLLPLIAFLGGNRELSGIASSTLINHRIKSNERSTVLSVRGFCSSIFKGAILIAFKPLSDYLGIDQAFFWAPLLLLPALWICIKATKMNLSIQKAV